MSARTRESAPTAGQSETDEATARRVRQTELIISVVLRAGVLASLAIVIFGTVVTFLHHADYFNSPEAWSGLKSTSASFPTTPAAVLRGLSRFEGRAFVMLGLFLLILTPVFRVGVSIVTFMHERDRIFVVVTSIVFIVLVGSLFLAKGGGA